MCGSQVLRAFEFGAARSQIEGRGVLCNSKCIIRNADHDRQARGPNCCAQHHIPFPQMSQCSVSHSGEGDHGSRREDSFVKEVPPSGAEARTLQNATSIDYFQQRLEIHLFEESGKGASAVAKRELFLEIDFSHGAFEAGQVEERVVAKSAGAAWSAQDDAFNRALG